MTELMEDFTNYITEVAKNLGHDDLGAKIYAILYLAEKEVTLDEISEKSGYSLASVSIKIILFEKMGLVKKTKKPGSKRVYCIMERNRIEQIKRKINSLFEIEIDFANKNLPDLISKYKNRDLQKEENKKLQIALNYLEEIKKIEQLYEKIKLDMR